MLLTWKIYLIMLCGLFCVMSQPRQVLADGVIIVTTTEDELNEDGDCALREAIQSANLGQPMDGCTITGSAPYTVTLLAETYRLTQQGAYEDENNSGDLDISASVSLVGQKAMTTTIDGLLLDRILHVHASSVVTVAHVSLVNGKVPDAISPPEDDRNHGGAILNEGKLTLAHVRIADNQAGSSTIGTIGSGGGIYSRGSMTVSESILCNNRAGSGAEGSSAPTVSLDGGGGGGIYNAGELWLNDSIVCDNVAGQGGWEDFSSGDGGSGGGLHNTGRMVIARSAISGNVTGEGGSGLGAGRSGDGGGIANFGVLTLEQSIVAANTTADGETGAHSSASGGDGGGIFNQGAMTVTVSSIGRNVTGTGGSHGATVGGPAPGGTGGGIYNDGTAVVLNCTIHDNQTGQGGSSWWRPSATGGFGGGIYNRDDGEMEIIQSTISGNACGAGGQGSGSGGAGGWGGGIFSRGAVTMTFATISNNQTGLGGIGGDEGNEDDGADGQGGGVATRGAGKLALHNSIVADNDAHKNGTTADCADFSGGLRSLGYNLFGVESGCPHDATGDRISAYPWLGPLADYGGPTWVHSLSNGSPAVDAGDDTDCPPTDQRGVARPTDGNGDGLPVCDIGAFEAPTGHRLHLPIIEIH